MADAQQIALEQLVVELINRARSDPDAEVAGLGFDLNAGLSPGSISNDPKQPLAINPQLTVAARGHGAWMLEADVFSHTGAGGSSSNQRMRDAGYEFTGRWRSGENIAWMGTTGGMNDAREESFVRSMHDNLVESAGHRRNIMNDDYREIGLGQVEGQFTASNGRTYNAAMVVENFAASGNDTFLTGVVFDDQDGDMAYDPGEGMANVRIAVGGTAVTTSSAGGYSLVKPGGTQTVSFSGPGLSGTKTVSLDLSGQNIKLDLIDGDTVQTSAGLTLGAGVVDVIHFGAFGGSSTGNASANTMTGGSGDDSFDGRGGNDTLIGNRGNDTLEGGGGNDALQGGAGTDTAVFNGALDSFTFETIGGGLRVIGEGRDTVASDIERLVFDDATLTFAQAAALVGVEPPPLQSPVSAPQPAPPPPAAIAPPDAPQPSIGLGLALIDADTDAAVADIANGATITLAADVLDALSIEALPTGGGVGSVGFRMNGGAQVFENLAPYALFGGPVTDFLPGPLGVGSHTLTVAAYAGARGTGEVLAERTVSFQIAEQSAPPPSASTQGPDFDFALRFTDGAQGTVGTLSDGASFTLADLAGRPVSVVATTDDAFGGSMTLSLNGGPAVVESIAPYALFGDVLGQLRPGEALPAGGHSLSYQVHAAAGGRGELLDAGTIDFTVVAGERLIEAAFYQAGVRNYDKVADIRNGNVFDAGTLAAAGDLNIVFTPTANAPAIGSVALDYGDHEVIENIEPFALFGDTVSQLRTGGEFGRGRHSIDVTAYAGDGASGGVIDSFTLEFEIV
ncbi:MAG: CAP domain-containing protein [Pseudomonadota bacterium]